VLPRPREYRAVSRTQQAHERHVEPVLPGTHVLDGRVLVDDEVNRPVEVIDLRKDADGAVLELAALIQKQVEGGPVLAILTCTDRIIDDTESLNPYD